MPKTFAEDMEAAKWSTRKEALEAVLALASLPRLLDGDFADIVRLLKKVGWCP